MNQHKPSQQFQEILSDIAQAIADIPYPNKVAAMVILALALVVSLAVRDTMPQEQHQPPAAEISNTMEIHDDPERIHVYVDPDYGCEYLMYRRAVVWAPVPRTGSDCFPIEDNAVELQLAKSVIAQLHKEQVADAARREKSISDPCSLEPTPATHEACWVEIVATTERKAAYDALRKMQQQSQSRMFACNSLTGAEAIACRKSALSKGLQVDN